MLHPLQHFLLLFGDGPQLLAEHQPAVAVDGGERRSKIVHRARQEIGAVLIVFLQFQIGVQQAL